MKREVRLLGLVTILWTRNWGANFFGEKQILRARVDSLRFGDFNAGPTELAMLAEKASLGAAAPSGDARPQVTVDHALGGFLGTDLLTRYHAIIDIGQMTLSFKTSP
jgi:hypothetical protein